MGISVAIYLGILTVVTLGFLFRYFLRKTRVLELLYQNHRGLTELILRYSPTQAVIKDLTSSHLDKIGYVRTWNDIGMVDIHADKMSVEYWLIGWNVDFSAHPQLLWEIPHAVFQNCCADDQEICETRTGLRLGQMLATLSEAEIASIQWVGVIDHSSFRVFSPTTTLTLLSLPETAELNTWLKSGRYNEASPLEHDWNAAEI